MRELDAEVLDGRGGLVVGEDFGVTENAVARLAQSAENSGPDLGK